MNVSFSQENQRSLNKSVRPTLGDLPRIYALHKEIRLRAQERLRLAQDDETGLGPYSFDYEEEEDRAVVGIHIPTLRTVEKFLGTRGREYLLAQSMLDLIDDIESGKIRSESISQANGIIRVDEQAFLQRVPLNYSFVKAFVFATFSEEQELDKKEQKFFDKALVLVKGCGYTCRYANGKYIFTEHK